MDANVPLQAGYWVIVMRTNLEDKDRGNTMEGQSSLISLGIAVLILFGLIVFYYLIVIKEQLGSTILLIFVPFALLSSFYLGTHAYRVFKAVINEEGNLQDKR